VAAIVALWVVRVEGAMGNSDPGTTYTWNENEGGAGDYGSVLGTAVHLARIAAIVSNRSY